MKKYLLLLFSVFTIGLYSFGQYQIPANDIAILEIKASSQINTTFIPPDPQIANKVAQEATIIVHFIDGLPADEQWTNEAKAAFEYAAGLWEKAIYSDIEIHIDAYFTPLGATTLGSARGLTAWANFGATGVLHDLYEIDYFYNEALANKLSQADQSPSTSDIEANFSSTFDFYFGTDGNGPDTKYDFVSVVLHEIAHGLGFTANTGYPQGSTDLHYRWGVDEYPFIYCKFLHEGTTDLTSLSSPSTALTNMLTSNNLYFENYKVHAPSPYKEGSSISHLDATTYGGTGINSLMDPYTALGKGVHNLGLVSIDIMEKIGWGEVLDLALANGPSNWIYPHNDEFNIFNQTDQQYESSNVPYLILEKNKTYDLTQTYVPGALPKTVRLVAFHSNGMYYVNGSYDNNSLPDTYEWKRDKDGYVQGYVENYICNDCVSSGERQMVKFEKSPNVPSFEVVSPNTSPYQAISTSCDEIEFEFYSEDASTYSILYKAEDDFMELGVIIPNDVYNYKFSNLDENKNYEFRIVTTNSFGYSESITYDRPSCELKLIAYPNPAEGIIRIKDEFDGTRITDVEIRKVDNPSIGKVSTGNSSNEVDVNVNDLPNGVYNIKATDDQGKESSKIFIKN